MKNKVLILSSVASMIDQFNMSNINILLSLDYEVHVACNFEKGNTCSQEKMTQLKKKLDDLSVKYYQIDFTRSVFNITQDIKAYRQVKKITKNNKYKFIHCHSPIGGAIGRLVCRNINTKCIYTAHGFHFFKGAPLKNWMIFYPIEKWLSKYTDVLITINMEDYRRAKEKFHMKRLEYVPGVGLDIDKFKLKDFDKVSYRKKLKLKENDFAILSIGELNKNKNHEIVIKALAKLANRNIHYFIAGEGNLRQYLISLSKRLNISNQVHLLGFRVDIPELVNSVNLYILPSKREGLNVSLMEAMASGLPCLASDIRGNNDILNRQYEHLFSLDNLDDLNKKINNLMYDKNLYNEFSCFSLKQIKKYSCNRVNDFIKNIYSAIET